MRRLPIILWLSFLLISLAIGFLLSDLYRQGEQSRLERAHVLLRAACAAIGAAHDDARVRRATEATEATASHDRVMDLSVDDALASLDGVEGGVWNRTAGFIAYGFPTYGGSTRKSDVPIAEAPDIATLAAETLASGTPLERQRDGARETVLTRACPLPQASATSVAWALTRVVSAGPAYGRLQVALCVLLGFVVVSGVGLTLALGRWTARLGRIERALAGHAPSSGPTPSLGPALPPTGDVELDRIVRAFNALGRRLHDAQHETEVLAARMALADRLAALGRLSAGLAHEIRNPLAAMRLKCENALANGARNEALEFNLRQVARLENLVRDLLAMTQSVDLRRSPIRIDRWIAERVEAFALDASARTVAIAVDAEAFSAAIDPDHLGRALDNLVRNALEHAPSGSTIRVGAERHPGRWLLRVEDDGAGVPPAIRSSLFEPFVTARVNGTGLGLAIVREIVVAHGGSVRETHPARGACFEIDLPCPAS